MASLTLSGWVLRRVVLHPLGWAGGLIWISLWPVLEQLTPLGLTAADERVSGLLELSFLAGLAGASLALAVLSSGEAFLEFLPARSRLLGAWLALGTSAGLAQALVWLGAALSSGGKSLPAGANCIGLLVADLHLASLGACLLLLPAASFLRVALFLLLTWAVPALVLTPDHGAPLVSPLLDASRHLQAAKSDFLESLARTIPVATILLAGGLLTIPRPERR